MLFVTLLFVAACSNGSDTIEQEVPPPSAETASVALMLDVEPIDPTSDIGDPLVTSASLTISTVDVVYDDGTRHTVATSSRTIDMLASTDTITLGVADVPAGTITAVDVQVDAAEVVRDGEVLTVDVIGGPTIAVSPGVQVELGCTRVVTASFDPNASFAFIPPDDPDPVPGECDDVFDFESFAAGAKLRDQLAPAVTVRCENARDGGPDECLIFDTDMVSGSDDDLAGGNGNVVIIAEDVDDADGDGLVDDPDDDARGGVQRYTFDPPIDVDSVFVVDIDLNETNGKLVVVDAEGTTTERELPPIGNASTQTIDVRAENVVTLEVHFPSSGAVDDIAYHTDCPTDGESGPGSFELTPMFEFVSRELICTELPPDPDLIAPPLPETGFPPFYDQVSFLFDGVNPVQTGMNAGAVTPQQISVLHGRVFDRAGAPRPGVRVRVHGTPELGSTLTRADGEFDLAVNGGTTVTLVYEADGLLTAHRKLEVAWNQHDNVDDVVMIGLDDQVTTIDFSDPIEVARGTPQTDGDGTRTATLFFRQDTSATIVLDDGSTVAAPEISVRATEYTVGESGPETMPVRLPRFSAYTYAVELTADEAIELGAEEVRFDQPVSLYVDNFIDLPVGEPVPTGYYDRRIARWVPVPSARVIEFIGIDANGLALVDVDGSGVAADATTLGDLDFTDDELRQLAIEYAVGAKLWRAQIERFTPWDCNMGIACLPSAACRPPVTPDIRVVEVADEGICRVSGSVIETQRQAAGETVEVTGVPFDLHYRSSRQLGYAAERKLSIALRESDGTVPTGLTDSVLEISNLGGQDVVHQFGTEPPDEHTVTWNGLDRYGRPLRGSMLVEARTGYSYPTVPSVSSFGGIPQYRLVTVGRGGITFWQTQRVLVSSLDDRSRGLGGWSLGVHHRYDNHRDEVLLGDGDQLGGAPVIIDTALGGGMTIPQDWVDAGEAGTVAPIDMAPAPDGSLYVLDRGLRCVLQLRDGQVRSVFGVCNEQRLTEPVVYGISATDFLLSNPTAVAVGPEGDIYVADESLRLVVAADIRTGRVRHVAGSGSATPSPLVEPTHADDAEFIPTHIAVDENHTVYISNTQYDCVIAAYPDRIVRPFLGNCRAVAGWGSLDYDGALGSSMQFLGRPQDIEIEPDGSMLVALSAEVLDGSKVIRVRADGTVWRVAGGNGVVDNGLDGTSALDVVIGQPDGLALDGRGGFYVTEARLSHRVWHVDSTGIATVVAGSARGYAGDGAAAIDAQLAEPLDVARGFDDVLYIADTDNRVVRRMSATRHVPSRDGTELYEFDSFGRHLRTVDSETLVDLWTFGYDADKRVVTATDAHGNTTTIERDAAGVPTAIVGPFGHRSGLTVNADGYLAAVEDPAGQASTMTYANRGLLQTFTNRRGHSTTFVYDADGLLIGHEDAVAATMTLDRAEQNPRDWDVTFTTPEGRVTSYSSEIGPTGLTRRNTFPDGNTATLTVDRAADRTVTMPDGRTITSDLSADPRYGLKARNQGTFTVTLPSGLQSQTTVTEIPVLTDPDDPLSLTELTTVTDVNGRVFTESYDVATRTREESTPEGRVTTTLLDASGRVVQTQLPGRLRTTTTYDTRGNVLEVTQGTRTWSYSYDAATNEIATVTDPLGQTTSFDHDAVGRLRRETSPLGNETTFDYDPNGNMTSLTPPGRPAHTFSYAPVDLESQYTPPALPDVSMPETTYDYSLDRELELEARPDGRVIDWQYDSAGRLSTLAFPAETRDYSYDPATGQLTDITSTSGESLSFEYDGDLVTKTTWSGTVNASVEKQYDPNFFVVRETVNGAWPVDYVYDDDGLLVQAGDMTITRDPVTGFVTGTQLDNVTTQTTYNDYGERETHTAWFQSTMLYYEEHERDDLGRITKTTEIVEGAQKVWEYAYDLDGRLAEAYVDGQLRYSYTYDANGNRTQFEDPVAGVLITADYDDQDRLLRYGDTTYDYTANGELLSRTSPAGTTTYDYDVFANLQALTLPDGTSVDYSIDPSDRRLATSENGTFESGFVYRDQLKPIAALDAAGVEQRYAYGTVQHVPDFHEDAAGRFAYVNDVRGSVRLVVDSSSGSVAQRSDYSPFGVPSSASQVQPFGFDGGIASADGSVRFGARDYDPATGRWQSKDSARFEGGNNLLVFADDDPVNLIDRSGEGPEVIPLGPVLVGGVILIGAAHVLAVNPPTLCRAEESTLLARLVRSIGKIKDTGEGLRRRDCRRQFLHCTERTDISPFECLSCLVECGGSGMWPPRCQAPKQLPP